MTQRPKRPWSSPVSDRLKQRIIELRRQGLTNRRIAQQVGLPPSRVNQIVHTLIVTGRLQSRWLTREQKELREQSIIQLREQWLTLTQIAERLGLSRFRTWQISRSLVRQGRLAPAKRGPKPGYSDVLTARLPVLRELVRRRATLREIGEAFGVTQERTRQMLVKLRQREPRVFEGRDYYTITEVAKRVHSTPTTVAKLIAQGTIAHQRRGQRQILVTAEGLAQVQRALSPQWTCIVCGERFTGSRRRRRDRKYCSQRCRQRRSRKSSQPHGWRRTVQEQLQAYPLPTIDAWLPRSQAAAVAGITLMQLDWLRLTGLIAVQPHPTRVWRGTSQLTFSRHQMEIVRRVYTDWLERQS